MTLYLKLKNIKVIGLKQSIQMTKISCRSEITGLNFSEYIRADQTMDGVYQLESNMFIGPLHDQFKIDIEFQQSEQDQSTFKDNCSKVLEFEQFRKQKKLPEYYLKRNEKIVVKGPQNHQYELSYVLAINYRLIYSGMFGLMAKNIDKNRDWFFSKNQIATTITPLQTEGDQFNIESEEEQAFLESISKSNRKIKLPPPSLINKGAPRHSKSDSANFISTKNQTNQGTNSFPTKSRMPFYSGPCKNRNMFSCLDQSFEGQEINLMEPYYEENSASIHF